FFKKWYVPSNATLTIAGDFDTADVKKMVDKWFGDFPKTDKPTHQSFDPTPVTSTKHVEVTDDLAALPQLHYAWHSPKYYAAGDAELDILADALGSGGTGRLYKILVIDKQLAQNVAVYQQSAALSSTFNVVVTLAPGADLTAVGKIVDDE